MPTGGQTESRNGASQKTKHSHLALPEETPKKPLQPVLEETLHEIQEEETAPDELEVPPRKDLKVFLSKSSMLCMKFSHYFTPCIFYLKLFFTLDSGQREGPRRTGSTTQECWPRSSGEKTTYKRLSQTGSTLFNHPHLAIILCCYFTDSLFFTANCLHFTFRKEQFFQARREVGQRRKMARSKRHSSPTRPSQRKHARNPCSQGKA